MSANDVSARLDRIEIKLDTVLRILEHNLEKPPRFASVGSPTDKEIEELQREGERLGAELRLELAQEKDS